jgi:hypothetical protein
MSNALERCARTLGALSVAALPAQNWTPLLPAPAPLGRQDHALAYDAVADRAVLFGGQANGNFLPPQTWEWDGAHWQQFTPATAPAPRNAPAMAFDGQHAVAVLFGGLNASGVQSDTWTWANGVWTQQQPAAHPPARYLHAMTYDALRARVVLFGGFGSSARNDLWEWDGANWIATAPALSPSPRFRTALAFDAARARSLLFGGFDNTNQFGDTWEWDGAVFSQRFPPGSPGARSGHALAFDPLRSRTLLFGGFHLGELADTWTWDGANWTQQSPASAPPARTGHAMVCDPRRGSTLLFGGSVSGTALGDTWVHALAAARMFGAGCGAPPLVLQPAAGNLPLPGQPFVSVLAVPPATTAAFLAAGFSDRTIGATPLPLDLAPFGMPGCTLYQDLSVLALPCQLAGTTASQSLSIPNTTSLAGLRLYLQGWVPAAGANAAGLLTSNGLELTLGT